MLIYRFSIVIENLTRMLLVGLIMFYMSIQNWSDMLCRNLLIYMKTNKNHTSRPRVGLITVHKYASKTCRPSINFINQC